MPRTTRWATRGDAGGWEPERPLRVSNEGGSCGGTGALATRRSSRNRRMRMARMNENFEVQPEMRAFAEKSVEQAKQAFEGFISAAHRTVSTFEGQAETARKGAKDIDEILKLQADYIKTEMGVLTDQAKELGERTSRAASEATKPRH